MIIINVLNRKLMVHVLVIILLENTLEEEGIHVPESVVGPMPLNPLAVRSD